LPLAQEPLEHWLDAQDGKSAAFADALNTESCFFGFVAPQAGHRGGFSVRLRTRCSKRFSHFWH